METTSSKRSVTRPIAAAAIAIAFAAIMIIVHQMSSSGNDGVQLGTGQTSPAQAPTAQGSAALPDLNVSYVPPGFLLKDGKDASTPPSGTAPSATYMLTSGDPQAASWKGTIYIQEQVNTSGAFDLQAQKKTRPNAVDTLVHGKSAVFGHDIGARDGISGLDWLERPNLLISVVARGLVPENELRAVAEGVSVR